MKVKRIKCNKHNYDTTFIRKYNEIKAIVIHYTGNVGDTAENNGKFFSNPVSPQRSAHFFIDQKGNIVKSVLVKRVAWSVGIPGKGVIYNNKNTVSIELCDIANKDCSEKQKAALKYLVKRLRKKIGSDVPIIRHYDINGKQCPLRYLNTIKWENFRKEIEV